MAMQSKSCLTTFVLRFYSVLIALALTLEEAMKPVIDSGAYLFLIS